MDASHLSTAVRRRGLSPFPDGTSALRLPAPVPRGSFPGPNLSAPEGSARIVAGLVDREILPRLRNLHRARLEAAPGDPRALARLLIRDPDRFRAEVAREQVRGTRWAVLAGDMLAPVARALGVMWEEDLCDFLDVTEAMGRLRSVLREAIGPTAGPREATPGRRILLAGAPGDPHTYGLCHAGGLLRDAGWTTAFVGETGPDPVAALAAALEADCYDVLGFSLACDVHSPALRRAIPILRRASRNPGLRVVVGGALVARGGAAPGMWGADACLTDPALLSREQPAA